MKVLENMLLVVWRVLYLCPEKDQGTAHSEAGLPGLQSSFVGMKVGGLSEDTENSLQWR